MKLGIVMPLWKREDLTRLTLWRIARETQDDPDCVLVAVTDELDNGRQAEAIGFELVTAPNRPLSDKKNAGIRHLRGRVDGVVLLGSDDWAVGLDGVPLLERYRAALAQHPFLGPLDMWYADLETGRGGHSQGYRDGSRVGEPIGVGRAIRAEVLDAVEWEPRPRGLARGHDSAMRDRLLAAGFRCVGRTQEDLGVRLLDIKSRHSVTSFERLRLRPESLAKILAPFPEDEVAALRKLQAETQKEQFPRDLRLHRWSQEERTRWGR